MYRYTLYHRGLGVIIYIDFNLFQIVLNHSLFSNMYSEFKPSDVLIEACENEKNNTIY